MSINNIYSLQNFYLILNHHVLSERNNNTPPNKPYTRLQKRKQPRAYEINNIIQFWGNNKSMWFSHETINIANFELVDIPIMLTFNQLLSLILQYDQLYRHPSIQKCAKNNLMAFRFATQCALYIINKMDDEFKQSESWKQVFILLTLRHNNSLLLKNLALTKIKNLIQTQLDTDDSIDSLYIRFLNATIMDINKFKNSIGYEEFIPVNNDKYSIAQTVIHLHDESIHKHKSLHMMYHNILDPDCIKNATSLEKSHSQYSIEKNIKSRNQEYIQLFNNLLSKYIQTTRSTSDNVNNVHIKPRIALSISGGVDSMVCSYILCQFAKKYNVEVICLHICYNNRDCVNDELLFLSSWCSILNMKLYVRKIDEIQRMRNTKFRACYEEVTRKIRFSFYESFNCPVILGHNLDDCYENVFSNLSKQIHFDNLYGMKPESIESGITIIRPFLSIPKQRLIDYANDALIPHLYDSTPPWSRRGQTRNTLMPAIDNFDPNILKGLKSYIEHTNFLSDVWQNTFDSWLMKYKKAYNGDNISCVNDIYINKDDFFNNNYKNLNFWIQIWFNLELPTRPTNKSFNNLITTLEKNNYISCNLNKIYSIKNTRDHIIIKKDA